MAKKPEKQDIGALVAKLDGMGDCPEKVDILSGLAGRMRSRDPEKSLEYAKEAFGGWFCTVAGSLKKGTYVTFPRV